MVNPIFKSKNLFLFIFILLIFAMGSWKDYQLGELNYNVIFLFSITFLIFIYTYLRKNEIRFFSFGKSLNKQFLIFVILFIAISIIRDGLISKYTITVFLTYIATLVYIQFLYSIPFIQALKLFLKAMFILMLLNFYTHFYKTGSFEQFSFDRSISRFTGAFGGGLAGALAGLSAIFPLIIYTLTKNKNILFLIINTLLAWLILLLQDNRTAMLACIIIYLLFFLTLSKRNIVYKFFFILIAFGIYQFFEYYSLKTIGGENISKDAETRTLIWGYAAEQFLKNPFLGYGKRNPFDNNYMAQKELYFGADIADPHNSYFYFILKNGIFVSFFFFLYIISFIVISYRRLKSSKYMVLMIIPIYWLIISATGGDYFNFAFNFGSVIFGISLFSFLNHPDIINKSLI